MNKIVFITLFVITATGIMAQPGKRRQQIEEKIKSMQIAFITERLALTPAESEKFWPIFNQMEAEKSALNSEKSADQVEVPSERDAQLIINRHFENKEKEMAIEKKYIERLKTAIPLSKIARLLTVQRQFRQEIMSTILNKARNRRGME